MEPSAEVRRELRNLKLILSSRQDETVSDRTARDENYCWKVSATTDIFDDGHFSVQIAIIAKFLVARGWLILSLVSAESRWSL